MKSQINFTDTVSETLLIPIYMRALDAQSKRPILNDKSSIALVERIDYDFSKFDKAAMSRLGTVKRVQYFDRQTADFIADHANPVVVQLGAGLDVRAGRISDRQKAIFYDLDLPEVMSIRQQLLDLTRVANISASMFDEQWMSELAARHTNGDFLFVIEGVLMYFTAAEVKALFDSLQKYFANFSVVFDVGSSFMLNKQQYHDALKKVKAQFKWAVDDVREIEKWSAKFKISQVQNVMELMARHNWRVKLAVLLPLFRNSYRIVTLQVNS